MPAKIHLSLKGNILCDVKWRNGGRLAVKSLVDFDKLDPDERCAKCATNRRKLAAADPNKSVLATTLNSRM
jgi:hypothetical protein